MILEFKIKNYLSFKDEVTFSFEATADKNLEEYYVTEVVPGVRILKLGIVYGANASGKSNLISAFEFLLDFIHSMKVNKDEKTGFVPFAFQQDKNKKGTFELIFYVETKKYVYRLEITETEVIKESLNFYPGKRPAIVFNRLFNEKEGMSVIEYGSKMKFSKTAKEEIQNKTLKNTSFFAASQQVNFAIPDEIKEVKEWFDNQFLASIEPDTPLTRYTSRKVKENEQLRDFTLKFLNHAEFNISNVLFKQQAVPETILKAVEKSEMPDEQKKKFLEDMADVTEFEHTVIDQGIKSKYILPESLQSAGTMRYYGLSAPYYKMLQNNAFLAIDEIESSMHALLVNHLIREFLMNGRESKYAQLLVTTHNISLLNEKDLLRKDAVWFTNKQENGATELYSMADFDIRKELSYYNAYKIGKFGAIPNLD